MDTPVFGASFSLHRCAELGLDKPQVLQAALGELGLRRFRLMSYWNIHEPTPGTYDFHELDWQLDMVAAYGGSVTMAVGKRQPRWPECHMPDWAAGLPTEDWYDALFRYIEAVVIRYRGHPAIASWQLENEALLKSFGHCPDKDYSRERLRLERDLVSRLDPDHPLIMTMSDSWGLPWRRPHPDMYAMSLYRLTANKRGTLNRSKRPPLFYKLRAGYINLYTGRPVFIHELQAEPWLLKGITDTPVDEQLANFNADTLRANVAFARSTGLSPIDLWGLEWWYWLRERHAEPSLWHAAQEISLASNPV